MSDPENIFLLERSFEIISSNPIEQCVSQLWSLHEPRQISQMRGMVVDIVSQRADRHFVDIRVKRRNGAWEYTSAHLTGTLSSRGDDKTYFHIRLKLGAYYLIGAIVTTFVAIYFMAKLPRSGGGIIALGALIIAVYVWWTLFDDRRMLWERVNAIMPPYI